MQIGDGDMVIRPPIHPMALLYTVVSPFEGRSGSTAVLEVEVVVQAMLEVVVVAVPGAPQVIAQRLGWRRKCQLLPPIVVRFSQP